MRKSYQKICTLLAASDYNDRELEDFVREILHQGPYEFLNNINNIRNKIILISLTKENDQPSFFNHSPYDEIFSKIEILLFEEAKLTKGHAMKLIKRELNNRHPEINIPSEYKKGFQYWIHTLITIFTAKEILYIATDVRNRFTIDHPTDWNLR